MIVAAPGRRWRLALVVSGLLLVAPVTVPVGTAGPAAPAGAASQGVVRWGQDLTSQAAGGVSFDPTVAQASAAEEPWQLPIYDSLLHISPAGTLVPGLASSASIVDTQTVTVTLRPHVRFSDGTPFDADAVKAGILRNENAPNHGQFRAQLYDVSGVDVSSPTSLTIHLSQPVAAAFYPLLASPETYIVSPAAAADHSVNLNRTPVGAGPFVLQRFVPQQEIVLKKNPRYWNAASVSAPEIDIVNVPSGPQQLNGLESGLVDTGTVPLNDLPAVRGGGFVVQKVQPVGSMIWMPICKTAAPFDNVAVRQALSYGIDRQAINQAVLFGTGQPQWTLWPPGSPLDTPSLRNSYAYNPAKARKLLAQAGFGSGLSFSILVIPGIPQLQQVAQILQQQWKKIGVTMTIGQTASFVTDLYQNHGAPLGLIPEIPAGPTGLDMLNRIFVPGAIGDLCNYNDPALDAVANKLNATTPGSPQAAALWATAQTMIVRQALAIFIDSSPIIQVSDHKIVGNSWIPSSFYPLLDYWHVHVR